MADIALVTAAEARELDEDLPGLLDALGRRDLVPSVVVWDDPGVDWSAAALTVVRSTWDYSTRRPEFLAWSRVVASQSRLVNSPAVIAWNTDKVYLAELEVAGVEIVPSRFLQPSDPVVLPSSGEFVVKPTVGAGSRDAGRFDAADPEPAMAHAAALLAEGRTVMIQPYQRSVDERGETALLYFGGSFSHAINKGPLLARRDPGDPSTLQPSRALFAPERITPTSATKAERGAGDRVLEALAGLGSVGHELSPAPYVRIDLVEGDDGSTLLLEVELTEPSVFLDADSGAADRFADVLAALLVAERSR